MQLQFSLGRLLRCVTCLAIATWPVTWILAQPYLFGWAFFLASAALGGAIGALWGKTLQGIFGGLTIAAGVLTVGIIGSMVIG